MLSIYFLYLSLHKNIFGLIFGGKNIFFFKNFQWPVWEVNFYVICHSGNEKVTGLSRLAGLRWPVYGGNFIKDPMGVRQGNELLACLQRLAGL